VDAAEGEVAPRTYFISADHVLKETEPAVKLIGMIPFLFISYGTGTKQLRRDEQLPLVKPK
jgi:hypothetical protein